MNDEFEPGKRVVVRIWDTVRSFFTVMFDYVWTGFQKEVKAIWQTLWGDMVNYWKPVETEAWRTLMKTWQDAGLIDEKTANLLLQLKDTPHPADWLFYFMTYFSLTKTYADTTMFYSTAEMRRKLASEYSPEIPRAEELLNAAFIAPEKTQEVREAMKQSGYSDEHIDLMFLSAYRLYNEDVIRTLWLRGVLDDDHMFMRMRELGYTDTRTKEIAQSWPVIPGPMDLFHLVAKEAFEPDMIAKMGLGDEFPAGQVEWLKKQGISEEWAKKYWYAHWEQPSIGQGFEMLHRGVIGMPTLDMLFRTVEIPPFWRDKLTKIAYMPYTRVDVRRMHDMGVLTDEELIKSYMDLGYDEEHAVKMANFTIRYNRQHDKEMTLSQIMSGYRENVIEKRDALAMLKALEYTEDHAEYLLLFEDYKEEKEYQDDLIDNIRDRYQNNLIEEYDARRMLDGLNLPARQTNLLMDKWKIKRLSDYKLPSKTDLDKFLRNKIIDLDTYRNEMRRLGYNFQYTEWYEKLTLKKKAK